MLRQDVDSKAAEFVPMTAYKFLDFEFLDFLRH